MPIADQKSQRLPQEKAMLHCDSRVRLKVASDLRFRAAISEPKIPSFCGSSGDLAPSTRKSLAIAIVRFWRAKFENSKKESKCLSCQGKSDLQTPNLNISFVCWAASIREEQKAPENATHPKTQVIDRFQNLRFRVCCVFGCSLFPSKRAPKHTRKRRFCGRSTTCVFGCVAFSGALWRLPMSQRRFVLDQAVHPPRIREKNKTVDSLQFPNVVVLNSDVPPVLLGIS